ncbi:hypothetical protein DMC30DRAFT_400572 [Rhodotorula diobovata]|uniref:Proteophosphoglycan ppg4 n=1 Tax=Rhodotorula diobovata TaxID=5288 RepID=A0A5C5FT45_9BASI|nr:hypothetical protein DMC30DRAFT_400572 [Rhodotorula diobovata]
MPAPDPPQQSLRATQGTGGLLAPATNSQSWSTRPASVQALKALDERIHASPRPPPSPALSESGFSLYAPATPGSTTFHFEEHHRFPFGDEAFTPDLVASAASAASRDETEPRSSDDDAADKVVLEPVKDHEDREPFPRAKTPPFSPSQASFVTDRLSVQSTAYTDFSTCSPSPSPSLGSVRMATVTKVPMRAFTPARESLGARSVLAESVDESVEDAPEGVEETVWDAQALARTSMLDADRLPQDLAAILRERHAAQDAVTPTAVVEEPRALAKSPSAQTQLTVESWKEGLDAAVDQLSEDPAMSPEENAMRRMKSILGPKTRIISRAPWDVDAVGETQPAKPLGGRRSFDVLTSAARTFGPSRPSTAEASKEPAPPVREYPRSQSVSTLLSGRAMSADGPSEREGSLAGLGIGIDASPALTPSESRRSLRSLKPSPSVPLGLGEPMPDVGGASLAAYAGRALARPPTTRSGSSGRVPKAARPPAPAHLDPTLSNATTFASPTWADLPMSAPPTVSLFAHARALTASESKASLPTSTGSAPSTSPSASTPTALHALGSSPASSAAASYFSAVPGGTIAPSATKATTASSGFSGHRLISLEEARQRESERSAAAQRKAASTPPLETAVDQGCSRFKEPRTRDSTSDSLSSRRGVRSPSDIAVGTAPTKAIKPKKSGFLKRMMGGGGGDKHQDRAHFPDALRPSLPSSASILSLSSTTPASSLGKSGGLKTTGTLSHSVSSGRISFAPAPPPTDLRERPHKREPAPALSLRPVSMAFSAGLPSDFLATAPSPIAEVDSPARPPVLTSAPLRFHGEGLSPSLRSAPLPAYSEPLASPHAASFKSSVSPSAPSVLFDDASAWTSTSRTTTPITPAFCGGASSPFSASPETVVTPERFAALHDEYVASRQAWATMQFELESQVKTLEAEVQRLRAGSARACDKCGAVETGRAEEARSLIMQRPRNKSSNGALFGSNMAS